jgi:hypothetical protein
MKKNFSFITSVAFCVVAAFSCKSGDDDATVQNKLNTELSNRPGITASVNKGVVVLTGNCPDQDCKTNAENAIDDIKGVKKVVNNISIVSANQSNAPVEIASDDNLKTSVRTIVKEYKGVDADVNNGVITLRGQVKREDLQKLIISLNELRPKKIQNELVIK